MKKIVSGHDGEVSSKFLVVEDGHVDWLIAGGFIRMCQTCVHLHPVVPWDRLDEIVMDLYKTKYIDARNQGMGRTCPYCREGWISVVAPLRYSCRVCGRFWAEYTGLYDIQPVQNADHISEIHIRPEAVAVYVHPDFRVLSEPSPPYVWTDGTLEASDYVYRDDDPPQPEDDNRNEPF